MRAPTEKQYRTLLTLGSGAAGLSWRKRDVDSLLRRGWVTALWKAPYYQQVQITPDGLRALADAVERHGLPPLGPTAITVRRVCADCGGHSWHREPLEVDTLTGEPAHQSERDR